MTTLRMNRYWLEKMPSRQGQGPQPQPPQLQPHLPALAETPQWMPQDMRMEADAHGASVGQQLAAAKFELHYAREALENMSGSYEQMARDLYARNQDVQTQQQEKGTVLAELNDERLRANRQEAECVHMQKRLEAASRNNHTLVMALEEANEQLRLLHGDRERIASAGNVNFEHYRSVEQLLRLARSQLAAGQCLVQ